MEAVLDKPVIQFQLEGKLTDKSFYLPGIFTFEEYLTLHEDQIVSEWIDGKVLVMAAASVAHQRIGSLLEVLMKLYCETHKIGEVFRSPIPVKVSIFRGREPDLFYISKENSHIIKPTFINGAPDLAIEIVSLESVISDTEDKFDEYESAGVNEYWLIYPDEKKVEFFQLNNNKLELISTQNDGVFESKAVKDFWFRVEWLWEMEPPTIRALKELNLF